MDRVFHGHRDGHGGRGPIRPLWSLWTGVFAGPVAWAIHLAGSFAIVEWTCATNRAWVHHAVTAGVLLIALVGGAVAIRSYRATGGARETEAPGHQGRTHFLALAGVAVSAMFLLVILASEIPNLLMHPCSGR